jgi:hypothetical protein
MIEKKMPGYPGTSADYGHQWLKVAAEDGSIV